MKNRVPAHVVRRQLERFNNGEASCSDVCGALGVSRTRLYELRTEWLKDREGFVPGTSGGDRRGRWPSGCEQAALGIIGTGTANFALIADEMDRLHGFKRSRAAVRDYLRDNFPLLVQGARPGRKPLRRWECPDAGGVWQHDATPVRVWPSDRLQALVSTVDDHTREVIAAGLFETEALWAHFRRLRRAFAARGIPELVYTDGFSMFGHEGTRDLATKCGRMLHALGIAHRIAPTPQAKGKIGRTVGTLQRRLVPLLAQAGVTREADAPAVIDPHIACWNASHTNRTTGMTPAQSLALATAEKRSAYRPRPPDGLLDLFMAYHEPRRAALANTVDFMGKTWRISPTQKKTVWLVIHPDNVFWVVDQEPDPQKQGWPAVLAKYKL